MSAPKAETRSGRRLLVAWANEQEPWLRGLVAKILEAGEPLEKSDIDRTYEELLREKKLAEGESESVALLEEGASKSEVEEPLVLIRLSGLQNVNALTGDQSIDFNPGLTLLFGENGAGKSGYVRVLKAVSGARSAEPILTDIRRAGGGAPSAELSYVLGTEQRTHAWRDGAIDGELGRICVFDSRAIVDHLEKELTFVYTPKDLAGFAIVQRAIEAVRTALQTACDVRRPKGKPFAERFAVGTEVRLLLDGLGPRSDMGKLRRLAEVLPEELQELAGLRDLAGALIGDAGAKHLPLVRATLDLLQRIRTALQALERFSPSAFADVLRRRDAALEAHRHASEQSLKALPVPGILAPVWREFILAAERYIRESQHAHYPLEGDPCAYCSQPLTSAARELLLKYRVFCNDMHQTAASKAESEARQLIQELVLLDLPAIARALQQQREHLEGAGEPAVYASAAELLTDACRLVEQLQELKDPVGLQLCRDKARPLNESLDLQLRLEEELKRSLESERADRVVKLQGVNARLGQLEDRVRLRDSLPEVERYFGEVTWAARAQLILDGMSRILKSLTSVAKLASEQLLNQDFEQRFREECAMLIAPEVILEFPGRKGEVVRKKSLGSHRDLGSILSEGEQKVLALADFLAEAALRKSASPLVLDDPVNSLDYKRVSHVASRIFELSAERQVIVFTHNIWFTMELLEQVNKENRERCSYFDVSAEEGTRGLVRRANSPRLDSWGDKKARINKLIARASGEVDVDVRQTLVKNAYEELRGACEIVVEQDLFQSVVQSYTPNIGVDKLKKIRLAKLEESITTLVEVHGRCCRSIASHRQPLETLNVRPDLKRLQEDWQAIQAVHGSHAGGT